ncbi:reverse transcriptase domain-containing protein [Tanacetum coccineum]
MKVTHAPILVAPDWDLPFEIMYDASDFAVGTVLGQRKTKHFQPIHSASKTMNELKHNYTYNGKKKLLARSVLLSRKFRHYLVLFKSIVVYGTFGSQSTCLLSQDAKPRLIRWILLGLTKELTVVIVIKKEKKIFAPHTTLSRLENPIKGENREKGNYKNISSRDTWVGYFSYGDD